LTQLLSGQPREEQATAAKKELEMLLTQYQEVQGQIRARSPRYAALTQPQPLGLKEIQQQVLDQDTLLLEYALGTERSFLWAVTPTSISSFELPNRADIETTARRVYNLLTARSQRIRFETAQERQARIRQADEVYRETAAQLSEILLGPVADQLGTKRLLIVADGALQYLSFAALPKPGIRDKTTDNGQRTTDNRPLIVDHEIVSLPSASVLAVLRRELVGRQPATQAVAVLADPVFSLDDERVKRLFARSGGNPILYKPTSDQRPAASDPLVRSARQVGIGQFDRLRFSRREAEQTVALAPKEKNLKALDFAANRAAATSEQLSQYRAVHFATHGLINSEHPELSGIVLSLVDERGQPQDGFLRLHEIYNLKLPAEVVVLSACQTALGKEIKGEGMVGLTRGFMYAGAARVVASLWDVADESTAELMRRFYHGMLREGLRPAAALRAAQVALWKQRRWAAPYYWAAFVPQGEWK
jgi:CHAT domain-containing protein